MFRAKGKCCRAASFYTYVKTTCRWRRERWDFATDIETRKLAMISWKIRRIPPSFYYSRVIETKNISAQLAVERDAPTFSPSNLTMRQAHFRKAAPIVFCVRRT